MENCFGSINIYNYRDQKIVNYRPIPCGVITTYAGVSVAALRTGATSLRCYGVLQLIGLTVEVL